MLNLEKDLNFNQSTWTMCFVSEERIIFLSVQVQLLITVSMEKILVLFVEVNTTNR